MMHRSAVLFIFHRLLLRLVEGTDCAALGDAGPVFRSAAWLHAAVVAQTVTVVDSRSFSNFNESHIAGAVNAPRELFTVGGDNWPSALSGLLKDTADIKVVLQEIGLSPSQDVVVYGKWGGSAGSGGRIYWMLKHLGVQVVFLLAQGIEAYADLYPGDISTGAAATSSVLASAWDASNLSPPTTTIRATRADIEAGSWQFIVDSRSPGEYDGSYDGSEDRIGHMTGAVSFPIASLFDSDGACLKSCTTLKEELQALGWNEGQTIATYCTSGTRSGFWWAAFEHCDIAAANYDGSMLEWSSIPALPMSIGDAPDDSISSHAGGDLLKFSGAAVAVVVLTMLEAQRV